MWREEGQLARMIGGMNNPSNQATKQPNNHHTIALSTFGVIISKQAFKFKGHYNSWTALKKNINMVEM